MPVFAIVLLAILALLLIVAAATDIRSRIIPNGLNLAVALLALPWWIAIGLSGPDILLQIALSIAVLAIFGACFACGMMGGGDVKLLAALALWLPFGTMATMLAWMAIGGGVLTLAMLAAYRLRNAAERPEIPYGVAIVAATLLVVANDILTGRAA
jgi:prepilin peptidase CpaA